MKDIKKAIIILSVIIVVIVIIIFILNFNNNTLQEDNLEKLDAGKEFESNTNNFQIIEDPNIFFSISNILSNYIQLSAYKFGDLDNNNYNIQTEEEKKEMLFDLLDSNFINNRDINNENIYDSIENIEYDYNYYAIDIRVRYEKKITTYIMKIYLENTNSLELQEKFYIVRIDNENNAYSIEPILGTYNDIDEISVIEKDDIIQKNDYNTFRIETISIERLVKIYMDFYKMMVVRYPEVIYNNYLDNEYKTTRYGTLEGFKQYVENNKEEIQNLRATKYLIENSENGKKYVVLDQYQNTYEFYETSTMQYKIKLDTYTIPTEKFIDEYDKGDDKTKVLLNIDKWVEMLNNRDYTTAYSVLDETFRNNNIGSEENFEKIIRESLPLHYKVDYNDYTEENGTHVTTITLSDITGESEETKQISIIMQLQENRNFVMSFSFN